MVNKFIKYIGIFLLSLLILMVLGFSYLYIGDKVYEYRYNALYEVHQERFENAKPCYGSASNMLSDGRKCICDGEELISMCPLYDGLCSSYSTRCEGDIVGYTYIFNEEHFETLEELREYCYTLEDIKEIIRCEDFVYGEEVFDPRFEKAQFCYQWMFGSIMGTKCICDGTLLHSKCPVGYSCDSGVVKCDGEIIGFVYVYFDEEFETLEEFEMYCNELDEGRNKESCLAEVERFRGDN